MKYLFGLPAVLALLLSASAAIAQGEIESVLECTQNRLMRDGGVITVTVTEPRVNLEDLNGDWDLYKRLQLEALEKANLRVVAISNLFGQSKEEVVAETTGFQCSKQGVLSEGGGRFYLGSASCIPYREEVLGEEPPKSYRVRAEKIRGSELFEVTVSDTSGKVIIAGNKFICK